MYVLLGIPVGLVVKNWPANEGDTGSIPDLGKSSREGNGNPLQYSCLAIPTDRGGWWATVHVVTQSQTQQSNWTAAINILLGGFPGGSVEKNPPVNAGDTSLSPGPRRFPGEGNHTHSMDMPWKRTLWKCPWTEEPSGLESMQSQRVGHHLGTNNYDICSRWIVMYVHGITLYMSYFSNFLWSFQQLSLYSYKFTISYSSVIEIQSECVFGKWEKSRLIMQCFGHEMCANSSS